MHVDRYCSAIGRDCLNTLQLSRLQGASGRTLSVKTVWKYLEGAETLMAILASSLLRPTSSGVCHQEAASRVKSTFRGEFSW